MTRYDRTLVPPHLDDDWLYADPLAMAPDADLRPESREPEKPAVGCGHRPPVSALMAAAFTMGAAVGLLLSVGVGVPEEVNVTRTGDIVRCPAPIVVNAGSVAPAGPGG